MAVCICDGLDFYPKSISIYYELQSGIRVKRYGCPNLRGQSISTFDGDCGVPKLMTGLIVII